MGAHAWGDPCGWYRGGGTPKRPQSNAQCGSIRVSKLVRRVLQERDIKTVNDLVSRTGIGKRSLQRVFNEYIGISPKWVIRRYRLHELMERLNSGDQLDLSDLALELGSLSLNRNIPRKPRR